MTQPLLNVLILEFCQHIYSQSSHSLDSLLWLTSFIFFLFNYLRMIMMFQTARRMMMFQTARGMVMFQPVRGTVMFQTAMQLLMFQTGTVIHCKPHSSTRNVLIVQFCEIACLSCSHCPDCLLWLTSFMLFLFKQLRVTLIFLTVI